MDAAETETEDRRGEGCMQCKRDDAQPPPRPRRAGRPVLLKHVTYLRHRFVTGLILPPIWAHGLPGCHHSPFSPLSHTLSLRYHTNQQPSQRLPWLLRIPQRRQTHYRLRPRPPLLSTHSLMTIRLCPVLPSTTWSFCWRRSPGSQGRRQSS